MFKKKKKHDNVHIHDEHEGEIFQHCLLFNNFFGGLVYYYAMTSGMLQLYSYRHKTTWTKWPIFSPKPNLTLCSPPVGKKEHWRHFCNSLFLLFEKNIHIDCWTPAWLIFLLPEPCLLQPVKEKETKKMINWMSSVLECDGKLLVTVTLYRHVNMYMHSLSITKNKHINQDQVCY